MEKNNYTIEKISIFQINSKKLWLWSLQQPDFIKKSVEKNIKIGENKRNMEIMPKTLL